MWKAEPTPGWLVSVSSPPISSVSILAMVSPRPAPGAGAAALAPEVPGAPPRANGSKMWAISASVRPGPVSCTVMRAISRA